MVSEECALVCERQPLVVGVVVPGHGRWEPDGEQTEFPHLGPLSTEMLPGGPVPLIHHDGAPICLPHLSLARTKNGLFGSMPRALKFISLPVPGSG
jgi:hypothetical protein